MRTAAGCKLFGAHQALSGIQDAVVLLHSVVGCNFGSMTFHFACGHMEDVRQTCTVINDSDVVFSGERSLEEALWNVRELYAPQWIFIVTGCVSDLIQDDVATVARRFQQQSGTRAIVVEAAGYRGDFQEGFEEALLALAEEMEPSQPSLEPTVNILGFGADDPRLTYDLKALAKLMEGKVRIGTAFAQCTSKEVRHAPQAGLNLVFGRGLTLAKEMNRRFGTPYVCLDYPCGLVGAKVLWHSLSQQFGLDFSKEEQAFRAFTRDGAVPVYSYLQALHGMPAAVVATTARSRGLAAFLSQELGVCVEVQAQRESIQDLEKLYDQIRQSEAAFLLGSSFEQEIADVLNLPLLRVDYPVFDRVCLTDRPYIGARGTLCLLEDLLDEIFHARTWKGATYQ